MGKILFSNLNYNTNENNSDHTQRGKKHLPFFYYTYLHIDKEMYIDYAYFITGSGRKIFEKIKPA